MLLSSFKGQSWLSCVAFKAGKTEVFARPEHICCDDSSETVCAPVQRLELCLGEAQHAGREFGMRHGHTLFFGEWFSSCGHREEQLEWFFWASLSSLGVFSCSSL